MAIPALTPSPISDAKVASSVNSIQNMMVTLNTAAAGYLEDLKALRDTDFSIGNLPEFEAAVTFASVGDALYRPERPEFYNDRIYYLVNQLNLIASPARVNAPFSYDEPGYSSPLLPPLQAKLLNDIVFGGYGIDTNDEIALWNRERDRESLAAQANIDEIRREAASTSFAMPQGALYMRLAKANQERLNKISSVNRDIGLKRADMYVENRKFTIEKVLASEVLTMNLYNVVQDRLLKVATLRTELGIRLFEAGLLYFRTLLDRINTQIKANVDLNQQQVSVYQADVAAYQSFVNTVVSAAQVDLENAKMTLQRDIKAHDSSVERMRFALEQMKLIVENVRQINTVCMDYYRTGMGALGSGMTSVATAS